MDEALDNSGGRLRDVFKQGKKGMHPAWDTMIIHDDRKGMFTLSRPVPRAPRRSSTD
jgi:hypothetical protein